MFTFNCWQADFVASVSLTVKLTPAINYFLCCCYRVLIVAGVIVAGNKLIAGVME
jgi:hypothetical protein